MDRTANNTALQSERTTYNAQSMSDPPNDATKKNTGLQDYAKAEQMVQLALALPVGCLIGWLLGSWLDRHFHQG
jgi:F0F1-type ATP synthase assembly protein I